MTWRSRILALFPLLHMALVSAAWAGACLAGGHPLAFLSLLILGAVVLYIFPPLAYQLHNHLQPLHEGTTSMAGKHYSPWWGGHQIQALFIAIPALEAALRLVPGLYSAWLRLWGAQIGAGVYWTPRVEIVDRGLIDVGDGVVFGHYAKLCSHVISPRQGALQLYVARVRIGKYVLLGAESRLAPGSVVDSGVIVPYGAVVRINQHLTLASSTAAPGTPRSTERAKEEDNAAKERLG